MLKSGGAREVGRDLVKKSPSLALKAHLLVLVLQILPRLWLPAPMRLAIISLQLRALRLYMLGAV